MRRWIVLWLSAILLVPQGLAADPAAGKPARTWFLIGPENSRVRMAGLLQEANAYYNHRAEDGQVQKAAALYAQILQLDPGHVESLWRSARCYYWLADQLPKNQNRQRQAAFADGLALAKRALEISPDSAEANFWYGVLLGNVSCLQGIFESLYAVDPIIKSMNKVLAANPKEAFACHILSMVYRMAPGWPFSCGDLDKSLKYARLAVEYRPDSILVHLGLAEALLSKGRVSEAKMELKTALALPGPAEYQPETYKEKIAVQELLTKVEAERPAG